MAHPIGSRPRALVMLDDTIFDAQLSADSVYAMTDHLRADLVSFWGDREIDLDEATHLARDLDVAHNLAEEQCSLLAWARKHVNKVAALIAGYRARIQETRKAALADGLQTNRAGSQ